MVRVGRLKGLFQNKLRVWAMNTRQRTRFWNEFIKGSLICQVLTIVVNSMFNEMTFASGASMGVRAKLQLCTVRDPKTFKVGAESPSVTRYLAF